MTATTATTEIISSNAHKPTPYFLDADSYKGMLSENAFLLNLAVGTWVVMRKDVRHGDDQFHMPQILVSIFANGDFRTNEGERIGSGSGRYKGASSKRHTGDWRVGKTFQDEETAKNWITEELSKSKQRKEALLSDVKARQERRQAQEQAHSELVDAANPQWVENLLDEDGNPNNRWAHADSGEYYVMAQMRKPGSDTTALLALVAKQVEVTEYEWKTAVEADGSDNLQPVREVKMVWELSVGHYSSRSGRGIGSMSSGARKISLAKMLREALESACQYN